MRIKEYNYETLLKLKNPLTNYNVVLDFILNVTQQNHNGTVIQTFIIDSLDTYAMHDIITNEIEFITLSDCKLYYRTGEFTVPYIANKYKFELLKNYFMNYKLKGHLDKKLVVKKENKKPFKI